MATITGKRFQMTDGAASPINLFPYTVSEAVYGLNNSISNAISSALSTISLSTYAGTSAIGSSTQPVYYNGSAMVATDLSTTYAPYNSAGYLPLTGGTMSNTNLVTNLNADLLDGQHGSYYNNFLTFYDSGATSADSVTYPLSLLNIGTPSSAWWYVTTMYYAAVGSGAASQIATSYAESGPRMYIRQRQSVWTSWEEVYHSGNSNLSTVPWACSELTIGAPGSYGRIGCPYGESDTNKYNYIDFYGGSSDGDIRYIAGTWTGGDHISHRFLVGLGGSVDALTIRNNGNVGIGTVSPTQKLHVEGGVYASYGYRTTNDFGLYKGSDITGGLTANDGALYYSGHTLAVWANVLKVFATIDSTGDQVISSDETLKTNLKDVTYSVSDIAKCRAVTFDWKDGHGHSAGSIAQDWKPLIPELVHGEEGCMTLAYGQIALVNSILEAREIERLKERVAELENQLKMRS